MKQTLKPELKNPEMKATFFAQYWGQNVIKDVNGSGVLCTYPVVASNMYRIEESHLLLTPLDQITDVDLKYLVKAYDITIGNDFLEDYSTLEEFKSSISSMTLDYCHVVGFFDFLRSRGYALHWNGHSVKELIEAGYCQLRKGGGDE